MTSESETVDAVTIKNLENGEEYAFTAAVTSGGKTSAETTVRCIPTSDNAAVLLTFDSNPPEGLEALPTQTQIVYYGTSNRLDENTFTYAQGDFAGWSRNPAAKPSDSNLIQNQSDFSVTDEADIENGITLYAVWRLNPLQSATVSSEAALDKLIGGKTITFEQTLTPAETEGTAPYIARVEVSSTPEASFAFDAATGVLTLPSNTTEAGIEYSVTLTYHTVDANGDAATILATSDSAPLTLTVYPDTWVVFNNTVYKDVQVFDFTDTASLEGVQYDSAAISSGISEEGLTFTVPTNDEKKQITIPSDGFDAAVLTLIEMKWDKIGANVYIVEGDALYGWSPYKGGDNFMLGLDVNNPTANRWNAKTGSSMDISPETGSFNKYFILDDGSNLPTLGFNNNTPYKTTVAITSKTDGKKITTITPFNITFTVSQTENVTYTLKTVAFYTTAP